MGQRKGMPPRGDDFKKRVEEQMSRVDLRPLLERAARRLQVAHVFPEVHLDPPFRPESEC